MVGSKSTVALHKDFDLAGVWPCFMTLQGNQSQVQLFVVTLDLRNKQSHCNERARCLFEAGLLSAPTITFTTLLYAYLNAWSS